MIKLELHCHSFASPDSLFRVKKFEKWLPTAKIDMIAITDHNTIQGAVALASKFPERIIVGEEIEVTYQGKLVGEILAYYVKQEIPSREDVFQVLNALRDQGAYISIPHPMDTMRCSWSPELLEEIISLVDGVEIFNSRCVLSKFNDNALNLAQKFQKDQLVGSDAHSIYEIGRSFQMLDDFIGVEEFSRALKNSKMATQKTGYWVHLLSRWAVMRRNLTEGGKKP